MGASERVIFSQAFPHRALILSRVGLAVQNINDLQRVRYNVQAIRRRRRAPVYGPIPLENDFLRKPPCSVVNPPDSLSNFNSIAE